MTLRLHVDPAEAPLRAGAEQALPPTAARHAQVRRVQPGDVLVLFDGSGREWPAEVRAMTRQGVQVRVGEPVAVDRELPLAVTLAVAVPAGDRMDALVEKAAELGAAALQPLWSERSVLRLSGERAERRRAHWQAVAVAACEQCGRARVPAVERPRPLDEWLADPGRAAALRAAGSGADFGLDATGEAPPAAGRGEGSPGTRAHEPRWLLTPQPGAVPPEALLGRLALARPGTLVLLSGPEGGFTPAESAAACAAGFDAVGLGARVLRADTAPLAVLSWLGLRMLTPPGQVGGPERAATSPGGT